MTNDAVVQLTFQCATDPANQTWAITLTPHGGSLSGPLNGGIGYVTFNDDEKKVSRRVVVWDGADFDVAGIPHQKSHFEYARSGCDWRLRWGVKARGRGRT